jgi:hypothetical protein
MHATFAFRLALTMLPIALGVVGCGSSVPPSTEPHSLPVAGVGPGALGVVKLDLEKIDRASLARWLGIALVDAEPSGGTFARKLMLARDGLRELGIRAAVVVIPSIDALPEEIGLYLAGPEGLDREAIEDVFLRAGGLQFAGLSMSSAFAKDVGEGWYFFGWGDDGVLDAQDDGRAGELCEALRTAPAAPATLLMLAEGDELVTADMIPDGEARAVRRIRALAEAAQNMRALVVLGGGEHGIEWRVRFTGPDAARAAETAVKKVLGDVELLAEGSAAVGEIDENDLLGWKRLSRSAAMSTEADSLVLRATE